MLQMLNSIKIVEFVYQTGQKPLLVTASDLNNYVVKYSDTHYDNILMTEYLVGLAAKEMGIFVPEMCLINLSDEHEPNLNENGIRFSAKLKQPLLGFKHIGKEVFDLSHLTEQNFKPKRKNIASIRAQLLFISLFDTWVANEDRNSNNYNLLFDVSDSNQKFYAIDHGAAFNTLQINKGLSSLTVEDSLLSSSLLKRIFTNRSQLIQLIPVILQQFENNIQNVYSQMDNWIEFAPNQWNIDKAEWKLHCNLLWLTPEWHKKTIKTFNEIIEICF